MQGLEIRDLEGYKAEIIAANANGSIDSLQDRIINLTLSGGLVRLRRNRPGEFYVAWIDTKGEIYMSGALIYFASNNTWSIHT